MKSRSSLNTLIILICISVPIGISGHLHAEPDWAERALKRMASPPLGLPAIPHPPENPPTAEKIRLGQKLFFDKRLSKNSALSCAFCHSPKQGFTQNDKPTPIGVGGATGPRNAPTLLNIAYFERLFHDGREITLETQFMGPMTATHEMANPSIGLVIQKIKWLDDYEGLFEAAFDRPLSADTLGQALSAYQRALIAANSPFDQWRYGGNKDALTQQQQKGFELFTGNHAQCDTCHQIRQKQALLTDNSFHDIGYGWMREQERQKNKTSGEPDIGRFAVTQDPLDRWRFRTPTLRNIALTAPYMHDGRLNTLEEVVAFYNKGGTPHSGQDIRIKKLDLSKEDAAALVAFLKSLTSPDIAKLAAEIPDQ